jgi:hypothetical protein
MFNLGHTGSANQNYAEVAVIKKPNNNKCWGG